MTAHGNSYPEHFGGYQGYIDAPEIWSHFKSGNFGEGHFKDSHVYIDEPEIKSQVEWGSPCQSYFDVSHGYDDLLKIGPDFNSIQSEALEPGRFCGELGTRDRPAATGAPGSFRRDRRGSTAQCGPTARRQSAKAANQDPKADVWVALVKAEQKTSADVRKRWRDYCDVLGSGTRDPSLHGSAFLRGFFELSAAGLVPEPMHTRPMPDSDGDPLETHAVLAAKVKHGQKSPALKKAWNSYCLAALGTNDPLLHDNASLRHFLLHIAPQDSTMPTKDPYAAAASHASPLSECVRFMQSKKLGWKRQWDDFSDTRGGGIRDPARHPESVLWEFIMQAKPRCPAKALPRQYRPLQSKSPPAGFDPQPLLPPGLEGGSECEFPEGCEYPLAGDVCGESESSTDSAPWFTAQYFSL